ncbi:DUF5994 family protein [Corynebacterium sp.]|uniref:DUF5994 family protein n=1 Tax=Corynebacterium sp. TaxID=1720 RepID=UPI0025BBDD05|nr:DUF5994 family protein [Corynebacterium sp.]
MTANIRKPQWLNDLSNRFTRKPEAVTNLISRTSASFRLVWWPASHHIEEELPGLLESIAINVGLVVEVEVPDGEWIVPDGELVVMGAQVPVVSVSHLRSNEARLWLTDDRSLTFDVVYPDESVPLWARVFPGKQDSQWVDDGGYQ